MLAALSPADPAQGKAQTLRRRWLTWGAVLDGWGGAALTLRWDGAVPILSAASA